MSNLTAKILKSPKRSIHRRKLPDLTAISKILVLNFGTPTLGNFRDPVKEIFYIVLSARTNEVLYKRAFNKLMSLFPTIESISKAPVKRIADCVSVAGLGKKRAAQLKKIATRISSDFGKRYKSKMARLAPEQLFEYLTRLPGIGPKSALCVMMYSFDLDVFPVDTHVNRILSRLGFISLGAKYYQAQSILPQYIPKNRNKELHIGLIVLGRRFCRAVNPRCAICPILEYCKTGKSLVEQASQ